MVTDNDLVRDEEMTTEQEPDRRHVLQGGGLLAAGLASLLLPTATASAHEGHDHAPKTILDLKGKLVRIVGPDVVVTQEFIQDRVSIHVNSEGRIIDLVYG